MAANSTTVERTLVARLLDPTQHKREKLEETVATYQQALCHGFAADADTQRDANDIVVEYDLTGHAKNALKQLIPKLVSDADELQNDHTYPVRFTNEAARFDWDDTRAHPVCFRVPQAGRGTDFWIPLHLRESEHDVWRKLVKAGDEDVEFGELKLISDGDTWELHVTTKQSVERETSVEWNFSEVTPVGFDVGISQLLVGCAFEDGKPHDPFIYSGSDLRHARQKQNDVTQRLQERDADRLHVAVDEEYQRRIDDEIETATRRAVEYAAVWENPVIVLEDVEGIREDVDSERIHQWTFYQLQTRLEEKAAERGIPVRYVAPDYTSQICHACHRVGYRPEQAEFRCPHDDCWVSEYQADINAAANVARRLDPWGESLPLDKEGGDDVPRSGAVLTRPEDTEESEDYPSERRTSDDKAVSSTIGCGGAGTTPTTSSTNASSNLEGS